MTWNDVTAEWLKEYAYGIKWGDYDMPHYDHCTDPLILFIKANQPELKKRLKALESKAVAVVRQPPLSRPAQLWEPCERCGTEPSYLTAHGNLCAKCAGL